MLFVLATYASQAHSGGTTCPPGPGWPQSVALQPGVSGYELVFTPVAVGITYSPQNIVTQIVGNTINISVLASEYCIFTLPPPQLLIADIRSPPAGDYVVNLTVTFQVSGIVRTAQFRIVVPNQTVDTLSGTGLMLLLIAVATLGAAHVRRGAETS
jgi:hypothetical protein